MQKDLNEELKWMAEKQQAREATERRKVERKLKDTTVDLLEQEFADIGEEKLVNLTELMNGKAVGKQIAHVWLEDGQPVMYSGELEKLKAQQKYVVGYWGMEEYGGRGLQSRTNVIYMYKCFSF